MATLVLRGSKGSPLTHAEVDTNFTNLNTDIGTLNSTKITANAGAIVDADIAANAAISHSKLANITAASILMGNASNVPTATAVTGDVTINNTGVTAIGTGVIVDADVNASAAIAGTKISPNFGTGQALTSGAVTAYDGSINAYMGGRLLQVGNGNTTNTLDAFVDLKADSTYTEYGLRIQRGAGPNNTTTIYHRGTGALRLAAQDAGSIDLSTSNTGRFFINSGGGIAFNTTNYTPGLDDNDAGVSHEFPNGAFFVSRSGNNDVMYINRSGGDGNLINFMRDGSAQGAINVASGNTTLQAFCGAHWGRLADNSKPDILIGTVLETVDQSIEWKLVRFDTGGPKPLIKPWNGPEPIGTEVEFEYNGATYSGVLEYEEDDSIPNKHLCVKVSDTPGSRAVFGAFLAWTSDTNSVVVDSWNDMSIASVGNYFIRMDASETVAIGDYVESAGNGCAQVQADDILRASTIAKITSTTRHLTYDDGSYLVTCTFHCG